MQVYLLLPVWLDPKTDQHLRVLSAPSVENVQLAIEHIFPLVSKYQMEKNKVRDGEVVHSKMHLMPSRRGPPVSRPRGRRYEDDSDESDMDSSAESSEDDY